MTSNPTLRGQSRCSRTKMLTFPSRISVRGHLRETHHLYWLIKSLGINFAVRTATRISTRHGKSICHACTDRTEVFLPQLSMLLHTYKLTSLICRGIYLDEAGSLGSCQAVNQEALAYRLGAPNQRQSARSGRALACGQRIRQRQHRNTGGTPQFG